MASHAGDVRLARGRVRGFRPALAAQRGGLLSITTCAICVASAVFLIDDFDSPLDGLVRAPSDSMRATLARIDAP